MGSMCKVGVNESCRSLGSKGQVKGSLGVRGDGVKGSMGSRGQWVRWGSRSPVGHWGSKGTSGQGVRSEAIGWRSEGEVEVKG